jgi:hypothetical protein
MDEGDISTLLKRLARPNASGELVVERAAILASGGDFAVIMEWILAHDGVAEAAAGSDASSRGGLHGARASLAPARVPTRFVLPADTFA